MVRHWRQQIISMREHAPNSSSELYPFSLVYKYSEKPSGLENVLSVRAMNSLRRGQIYDDDWQNVTTFHPNGVTIGDPTVLLYPEQWDEVADIREVGAKTIIEIAEIAFALAETKYYVE
jgi:hypothetical protein